MTFPHASYCCYGKNKRLAFKMCVLLFYCDQWLLIGHCALIKRKILGMLHVASQSDKIHSPPKDSSLMSVTSLLSFCSVEMHAEKEAFLTQTQIADGESNYGLYIKWTNVNKICEFKSHRAQQNL